MGRLRLSKIKNLAVGDALNIVEPGFKRRWSESRAFSPKHYAPLPSRHGALAGARR